jgi:hypothetical protein
MPLPQIAILPIYRLLFSRAFWWVCATKVYSGRTHRYPVKRERGWTESTAKLPRRSPPNGGPPVGGGKGDAGECGRMEEVNERVAGHFQWLIFGLLLKPQAWLLPSLRVMVEGQR